MDTSISLPDDVRALAEERVASGRYASVSEYLADLVRQDQERMDEELIQTKLLERLKSPTKVWTDADFDRIRERLKADIAAERAQ